MSETSADAFARGHVAGVVDERLAGHDKQFKDMNGFVASTGKVLQELVLAVAALESGVVADKDTRLQTAAALKDAAEALRVKDDKTWLPLARAVGGISLVLGIIIAGLKVLGVGG